MPSTWLTGAATPFTFKRGMVMAPGPRFALHWFRSLALLLCMVGAVAHAVDVLDRQVSFHIAASSLSSALLEFSTQSGVQVAVADSNVSHLSSYALDGTYSIQQALGMLLHGSGLEFARVGVDTVAIRNAPNASVVAVNLTSGRGPTATAGGAPEAAAPPDPGAKSATSAQFSDITVVTPRPPSVAELAGDSLSHFVIHHGTVHYVNTGVTGGLTRWRGGRPETVCPKTSGLDPSYNAFVTARLREVASKVGAPVQQDPACTANVYILFSTEPDKLIGGILHSAAGTLGVRYPHQIERELAVSSGHTVQGWYMTADGGSSILNRDVSELGSINFASLWPRVIPTGLSRAPGYGGIVSVILLIDTRKVAGMTIGAIADYVAVATLTFVESPEHCDPLPSILDLTANCGREPPTAITAGDLAFLRALYYHNTGLGPTLTREEIQRNMIQQFKGEL